MAFYETDYVDFADIPNFKIESVIQFQSIGARRDVDNRDVDKTLSSKTSDLYKAIEESQEQIEAKEGKDEKTSNTPKELKALLPANWQPLAVNSR